MSFDCAVLMYQSGIERFVYAKPYRKDDGLKFLRDAGVEVKKLSSGS